MSLTTEEIGLLRSLVEWRRANGWTHERRWQDPGRDGDGAPWGEGWRVERWSDGSAEVEVWLEPGEDDRWTVLDRVLYRDDDGEDFAIWDGKLATRLGFSRLLDSIVATAGLPAQFSSAFQAGRESAYDRDEWRVAYCAPIGWLRSSTRTRPEADEFLAYCAGKGVAGAYLESRRSGATAWVRVPEAGDTDV